MRAGRLTFARLGPRGATYNVNMLSRSMVVLCLAANLAVAADVRVIEQIVAKVNGDIITRGELERQRVNLEASLKQQGLSGEKLAEAIRQQEKELLRDQIDQLLLVQRGKDLSINVDPEVTRYLAQLQVDSKIADPDKFQQYIREQTGMPYEDFKAQVKNQMLTQRVVRQEVGGKINIPKEELQKYYEANKEKFVRKEEVYLREIFLSTQGKDAAVVEKKAKDIVARAKKGEKFGDLAKQYSESESAKNNGDLGWWKKGDLNPVIEGVVFKEKKNFVSDPIKVDNGFEIVRLEERHEAGQAPFEEAENDIMEILYTPLMPPKMREFLTKLREDAFLEIREGYVDVGAASGKDTRWKDVAQLKPETTTKAEVAAHKKRRLLKIVPLPGGKNKAAEVDTSALGTKNSPGVKPAESDAPAAPKTEGDAAKK
jgi:peptidyl-prolyl cis-trans isomerase SurA